MSGFACRVDSWQLPLSILLNTPQLATPQFQTHTRHYVKTCANIHQQTALERLINLKSLFALYLTTPFFVNVFVHIPSQLPTSVQIRNNKNRFSIIRYITLFDGNIFPENSRFSSHVFPLFVSNNHKNNSTQQLIHKYVDYSFYLHLFHYHLAWWLYHSLTYHKLFPSSQRNYQLNFIYIDYDFCIYMYIWSAHAPH